MHVPPTPTVVLLVTRLLTPYRPIPSPPQTTSPPTPHWTIHRPRSGWYLALRPSHPTPSTASTLGSSGFVPLEPLRTRSRSTIGTQLAFALRLPPSSSLTSTSTSPKANTPSPSVEITIPPLDSAGVHPAADGGGAVARFVLRGLPPAAREVGWWGAVKAGGAGLRDAIWGAPRVGWGCYAVLREGEEEVMRWEDTTRSVGGCYTARSHRLATVATPADAPVCCSQHIRNVDGWTVALG